MNRQIRTGPNSDRLLVLAAFACVYFIWGSTYLAIRFAVEAMPPFLMVAGRCFSAGAVLYAWARLRGDGKPTVSHWWAGVLTGGLLFAGGQSVLARVEQFVDSGLAALVLATIPAWMIVLQLRQKRPDLRTVIGVVLGLSGVGLLVIPSSGSGAAVDPLGALLLTFAALSWAMGSLVARKALPASSVLTTALQLLGGGIVSALVGLATGEVAGLATVELTARSILAFAYLTVFGTLVTFTAYAWLLNRCEPAAVGSYAFVNPVVAVVFGWAFGGESMSTMTLLAAAVIVSGVYLVVTGKTIRHHADEEDALPASVECEEGLPCVETRGEAPC